MDRLDVLKLGLEERKAIASLGILLVEDTLKFPVDYRYLLNAKTCGLNEGAFTAGIAPYKTFKVDVSIPKAKMP